MSTATVETAEPREDRASRRRPIPGSPWGTRLLPVAGVASVLLLWELVVRVGLVNATYFPPVSTVVPALVGLVGDPALWADVGLTLQGWAVGLLIAVVVGVALGMICGLSTPVFHALRPIIEFLRPIPSVALIPLAIIAFGAGMESKVFLAAFASTWPILVQAMYGIRDLDPTQFAVMRSYRVSWSSAVFRVLVPSAVPYIATGVRISSSIALALVVSSELIIGSPGLGQAMNIARAAGAVEQLFALIIVAGCLGWALNAVMLRGERRLLRWHPSHREVVL